MSQLIWDLISGKHPEAIWGIAGVIATVMCGSIWRRVKPTLQKLWEFVCGGLVHRITPYVSQALASRLSFKEYARLQLRGSSSRLRVPAQTDVSLDIDRIFVPLVLESTGAPQPYNHATIVAAANRIQIIGDPGSGKSSIAKRIFRDACKAALDNPRKARFPVLIELRTVGFPSKQEIARNPDWILQHIRKELAGFGAFDVPACLDAYLKTSGMVLILDGLDEVSGKSYESAKIAINSISDYLHKNSLESVVILTMRTQMHQQIRADFASAYPLVAALKRFSPSDIYEFLSRWEFPKARRSDNIIRIYKDLTDHPNLREMCTNPLILAMYVARDQGSGGAAAPDTRTDFYYRVNEELLVLRRASQIGAPESIKAVREQRERILGQIAYSHMLNVEQPANQLYWMDAVRVVGNVMRLDDAKAEARLRELAVDTGIISEERTGETFRFIHLTFCEFFAAFEAVHGEPEGWRKLLDCQRNFANHPALAARTRLIEILPFACALLPRQARAVAISEIEALGNDRVLSLAFLETKAYDHPVWQPFAATCQQRLLAGASTPEDRNWLAEVHLFTVVCGDADRAATIGHGDGGVFAINRFFEGLASSGRDITLLMIAAYAEHDAAAAFRIAELLGIDLIESLPEVIVKNCDQPPFLAMVIDRLLHESKRFGDWTALIAEASLLSPAVANMLWNQEERPWKFLAAQTSSNERWFGRGAFSQNTLTECLTLARTYHTKFIGNYNFVLLTKFRDIRPPTKIKIFHFGEIKNINQSYINKMEKNKKSLGINNKIIISTIFVLLILPLIYYFSNIITYGYSDVGADLTSAHYTTIIYMACTLYILKITVESIVYRRILLLSLVSFNVENLLLDIREINVVENNKLNKPINIFAKNIIHQITLSATKLLCFVDAKKIFCLIDLRRGQNII